MAMLSRAALEAMGFAALGQNVMISDRVSIYNAGRVSIGNNVRIDDFCVLSAGKGGISIGDYVHIAAFCSLVGAGAIRLSSFCGLSSRVSIYSSSDDYSGATLTNPTVPSQYTGVRSEDVTLEKHVIVGCGSVILPGVTISEGAAIGALSLVQKNCEPFSIYSGVPAKLMKARKQDLLELEHKLLAVS
ncbi:acyltransferase [Massilia sp. UMI-21]|nr:acyltransferase [Massilia sp. UMI-21]